MLLPKDIIRNILSEYIEYDQLQELIIYIPYFYFDSKRIKIEENKELGLKTTCIDNEIIKTEHYDMNNIKCREENFKKGILHGKQLGWYSNGVLVFEENYNHKNS